MTSIQADAPSLSGVEYLWDVSQVAKFLGVSRSWVYHRVEAALLPCVRVGGLVRFNPLAVRAWVKSGSTRK